MKLTKKYIEKDRSGTVTLVAEDSEDMWHTFNLLLKGDHLKASTLRYLVSVSATGSTEKNSVRTSLTIEIESLDFDAQGGILRVNGRNVVENKFIKMGAYHTIDLESNRPFTIGKAEWDVISLERIESACDISKKADIAAVILQEGFLLIKKFNKKGLANVTLVTESMTVVRQRIETPVPRKRKGSTTSYEKGLARFFEQVLQGIIRHVNFDIVKVLIIASPGFIKDQLFQYIISEALKTENKSILNNKSKIILVHSSSGQKHALTEVLQEPAIQARLSDTKYAQEVKTLDRFYTMLNSDPSRAFYGFKHVTAAADQGAIETLMITDSLFKAQNVPLRKKYIQLVELVRSFGGKTLIFSSLHTSGEQLSQLTGVAAILTFPLPDLEDMDMEMDAPQESQ